MHGSSFRPPSIFRSGYYEPNTDQEKKRESSVELQLDPDLVRGASLRDVLRCAGHVLSSSEGCAKDFQHSRTVEALDVFICHTWDTGRASKLTALALHGNARMATFVTLALTASLVSADVFSGRLLSWYRFRGDRMVDLGMWCVVSSFPCYWSVLFFHREIFCLHGPTVFFDKLCIHQVDITRRSQGIKAIPKVISKATQMLVVLTPSTLTRVWTMFELSSFLILRGPENLKVQPALLSSVCLLGSFVVYVASLAFFSVNSMVSPRLQTWVSLVIFAVLLPPSALFARYLYKWGLEIKELEQQAQKFNFDTAICAVEEDRTMLKSIISDLYYASVVSELDGTESEKVRQVREYQRELQILVAETIRTSMGRAGLPLHFWLYINIAYLASEIDSLSGDFRHVWNGEVPSYIAGQTTLRCLADITFTFALESVISYLCIYEAQKQCLRGNKWASRVTLCLSITPCVFLFPSVAAFNQFTARVLLVEEASSGTLMSMCAVVLIAVLVILFFHCKCFTSTVISLIGQAKQLTHKGSVFPS